MGGIIFRGFNVLGGRNSSEDIIEDGLFELEWDR